MQSRLVGAVLHKAIRVSGALCESPCLFLSLNAFDPDRGPCLARGCARFLRVPLLASHQGIRFSPCSQTSLCSPTLDVSHRYLQARWSAEEHLADVCGKVQSGTTL